MDQDDLMIFQMMLTTCCNCNEFFTSHEMEEGMGIRGLGQCYLRHIGYNVNHTKIIEKFDKFYILGVWWVGIYYGPYHKNPH